MKTLWHHFKREAIYMHLFSTHQAQIQWRREKEERKTREKAVSNWASASHANAVLWYNWEQQMDPWLHARRSVKHGAAFTCALVYPHHVILGARVGSAIIKDTEAKQMKDDENNLELKGEQKLQWIMRWCDQNQYKREVGKGHTWQRQATCMHMISKAHSHKQFLWTGHPLTDSYHMLV